MKIEWRLYLLSQHTINILKKELEKKTDRYQYYNSYLHDLKKDRRKSKNTRVDLDKSFKSSQKSLVTQGNFTSDQKSICNTILNTAEMHWDIESTQIDSIKICVELLSILKKNVTDLETEIKDLDREQHNIIIENPILNTFYNI